MRAIVINPFDQTITEATVSDYTDTQKLIGKPFNGQQNFTVAIDLDNNDSVYVDDDGIYSPSNGAWFDIGAHQPFAGVGVVVGLNVNTGGSVDAKSTIDELKAKVKFMSPLQVTLASKIARHLTS